MRRKETPTSSWLVEVARPSMTDNSLRTNFEGMMSLALTPGRRGQCIHLLTPRTMAQTRDYFCFMIQVPVKHYCAGT